MMPPSNQVESNAEDSSSSGGSVVQSMNLLSTAKGSSSSSGDSPDNSDMSGKNETSEVSEDSDHESGKEATDCTVSKSALDLPTKEKAPLPIAATQEKESHVKSVPTRADELVLDVASASVPPENDSDQSVEALALIAVEAAAKHAPVVQAGVQVSSNATGTQLKPLAESLSVAGSSQSVNLHGSSSSDQSVQYTVDSSISGNSSRSNVAPFSPTSGFQTIGAAAAAAVAAAVELPMGQIHLKQARCCVCLFSSIVVYLQREITHTVSRCNFSEKVVSSFQASSGSNRVHANSSHDEYYSFYDCQEQVLIFATSRKVDGGRRSICCPSHSRFQLWVFECSSWNHPPKLSFGETALRSNEDYKEIYWRRLYWQACVSSCCSLLEQRGGN